MHLEPRGERARAGTGASRRERGRDTRRGRSPGTRGLPPRSGRVLLVGIGMAAGVLWGVPAQGAAQAGDEAARALFQRAGCVGCHARPPAVDPGLPVAGLAAYLRGETLPGERRHPAPLSLTPAQADTLARWLLGGGRAAEFPPAAPGEVEAPPPGAAGAPAGAATSAAGPEDPLLWPGALPEEGRWLTPAAGITVLALALVLVLLVHPAPLLAPGGRLLGVLALVALPVLALSLGAGHHLERSRGTDFCLSCHVMEPLGRSLVPAPEAGGGLAALHFRERLIPRDAACHTCHTQYTMYGDLRAKALGVRHLWVNYVSGPPETLALYSPYRNRECLHCHEGAGRFDAVRAHAGTTAEQEGRDLRSCLDCHGPAHGEGS